jgi:hypothetical protein
MPAYCTESQASTSLVFPQGVIQRRQLSYARSSSDVISPAMCSPASSSLRGLGEEEESLNAHIWCWAGRTLSSLGSESCVLLGNLSYPRNRLWRPIEL